MKLIIETNDETVTMEFSNPKSAQLFHDQIKAQSTFMGKWLKSIKLEQAKPKKSVNTID